MSDGGNSIIPPGQPLDARGGGPPGARFVRLATVGDVPTAHVLAARLESEGIEVRVHGFSLGPYPMMVGELAETELWVLDDRLNEASTILLDAEVNDALHPVDEPEMARRLGWNTPVKAIATFVAAACVGVWLLRVFRLLGLY